MTELTHHTIIAVIVALGVLGGFSLGTAFGIIMMSIKQRIQEE